MAEIASNAFAIAFVPSLNPYGYTNQMASISDYAGRFRPADLATGLSHYAGNRPRGRISAAENVITHQTQRPQSVTLVCADLRTRVQQMLQSRGPYFHRKSSMFTLAILHLGIGTSSADNPRRLYSKEIHTDIRWMHHMQYSKDQPAPPALKPHSSITTIIVFISRVFRQQYHP
ncbi:hypothetical protein CC78DRAFT_584189 [Lojkania enalia]|uniref:Uncharacterized protein n=1 Tax=Lojkania enalia TaxID=147567 RepID=A0A9P4K7M2_9PLEO|nr:hypothetical protein CC78DRAFT_584189 [Didymosphaeria enalia]